MIRDGEERGILTRGKSIIVESTSGNTGIALAGIANLLGCSVEIVMPEKASSETKLVSPSSAAVCACMKKYRVPDGSCVVGVFADDGRKFKSVYAEQNVMSAGV